MGQRKPMLNGVIQRTYYFNRLILYFFFYGFIGWAVETLSILVLKHHFSPRGWLHLGLPFIPLYAFTCLVIITLMSPLKNKPLLVFLLSILIISVIEFFSGLILTKIFHLRFWNYNSLPPAFMGLISLPVSLLWGGLSLVLVYWIHPAIERTAKKIPSLTIALISWFLMLYLGVCFIIETYKLFHLLFP